MTLSLIRGAGGREPEASCRSARLSLEYLCHVYVRNDSLAGVVIADSEYPSRVAFTLLEKVSVRPGRAGPRRVPTVPRNRDEAAPGSLCWQLLSPPEPETVRCPSPVSSVALVRALFLPVAWLVLLGATLTLLICQSHCVCPPGRGSWLSRGSHARPLSVLLPSAATSVFSRATSDPSCAPLPWPRPSGRPCTR